LYSDRDAHVFMDTENFEQYSLGEEQLGEQARWVIDGLCGVYVLLHEGSVLSIELPASIDLEISDTAPAIKGASVTNRNKSATLINGVVVQVPEYLTVGEIVRVNTETGKYISRAKA
jgi:elongation factor P